MTPRANQSYIYRYTVATALWTVTTASTVGKRWIHDQDPSGGSHFFVLEVDAASGKGNYLYYYRTLTDVSGFTLVPQTGAAPTYSGIMINDLGEQQFEDPVLIIDDIIFFSTDAGYQDRMYQVRALAGPTSMTVERLWQLLLPITLVL